jgi:hypothetical protein
MNLILISTMVKIMFIKSSVDEQLFQFFFLIPKFMATSFSLFISVGKTNYMGQKIEHK